MQNAQKWASRLIFHINVNVNSKLMHCMVAKPQMHNANSVLYQHICNVRALQCIKIILKFGSEVQEPVPKPGTRNRFLNIVSLTHCIICVLYESLFVKNESRSVDLKLMRISFHFFIHSFIHSLIHLFVAFISSQILRSQLPGGYPRR